MQCRKYLEKIIFLRVRKVSFSDILDNSFNGTEHGKCRVSTAAIVKFPRSLRNSTTVSVSARCRCPCNKSIKRFDQCETIIASPGNIYRSYVQLCRVVTSFFACSFVLRCGRCIHRLLWFGLIGGLPWLNVKFP